MNNFIRDKNPLYGINIIEEISSIIEKNKKIQDILTTANTKSRADLFEISDNE